MQTAVDIVERLNSVQTISLLKRLNQILYGAVSYKDVQAHLPSDVDDVILLEKLNPEMKKRNLDPKTSVELARHVLMAVAQDKALGPILVQAWDEIREDDSLFIETIVAVGLIVNLTLFMATSKMELRFGKQAITKEMASPDLLTALLSPVKDLVGKIVGK